MLDDIDKCTTILFCSEGAYSFALPPVSLAPGTSVFLILFMFPPVKKIIFFCNRGVVPIRFCPSPRRRKSLLECAFSIAETSPRTMILKTATLPLAPAMRVAREKSRLSTERMVTVGKRQIAVKSLHGIQRSLIGFILRYHLYGALIVRLPCVHILVNLRQMPLRGKRLFCHNHAAAHCQDDCKQCNAPHNIAPARLNATVCRGWEQKRHGAYAETIRVPSLIQGCTHQPQNTMQSAAFRHSRPTNGRIIRT